MDTIWLEYEFNFREDLRQILIPSYVSVQRGPESEWAATNPEQEKLVIEILKEAGIESQHFSCDVSSWIFKTTEDFEKAKLAIHKNIRDSFFKKCAADPKHFCSYFPESFKSGSPVTQIDRQGMWDRSAAADPCAPDVWQEKYADHLAFLEATKEAGGLFGKWEMLLFNRKTMILFIPKPQYKEACNKQLNFNGQKLSNLDLSKANLSFANISLSHFEKINFSNAYMYCAMGVDSHFEDCNFSGCLLGKDYSRSRFINCQFSRATIITSDFENCEFINCDFTNVHLSGGKFPGAVLKNVTLI